MSAPFAKATVAKKVLNRKGGKTLRLVWILKIDDQIIEVSCVDVILARVQARTLARVTELCG